MESCERQEIVPNQVSRAHSARACQLLRNARCGSIRFFKVRSTMRLCAVAVFLFALFAAASSGAASPSLTGRWRIVSVAGTDGLDVARTHAEFSSSGRFASTIGCNRMSAMAMISGARLSFGPMTATRMACPPPLDQVERFYVEALRGVRGYKLSGRSLTFLGNAGEMLVALERAK
ncbi:MAG: META domain-containing protein [Methylocystis sp.]